MTKSEFWFSMISPRTRGGNIQSFIPLNFTVLAYSDMSISQDLYTSAPDAMYCTLRKSKLFICESCPILVLTTILSNPRRANSRKCDSKIHNFPHTFFKILVWLWPKFVSVLDPRVTSNARLRVSIFSNPSYFCTCNYVPADKAHLALSTERNLHILNLVQKCDTRRDPILCMQIQSNIIC